MRAVRRVLPEGQILALALGGPAMDRRRHAESYPAHAKIGELAGRMTQKLSNYADRSGQDVEGAVVTVDAR